ncbi:hypothetical protein ACLE20_00370 [Rhizobium sp. YIM 134829]|uniref:hypothetical protein n=1 Tax=Rhizobium sp. YIM 134829 TaxID=3390453 RepID=UPI00397AB706
MLEDEAEPLALDAGSAEQGGGLERKGRRDASAIGALEEMLAGTVSELKGALEAFRARRTDEGGAPEGEAARKAAQAEAKASIDAISLIVRTLEKIDSLQRTLADEQGAAAEPDDAGYEALVEGIERILAERIAAAARRCSFCGGLHAEPDGPSEGEGDRTQGAEGSREDGDESGGDRGAGEAGNPKPRGSGAGGDGVAGAGGDANGNAGAGASGDADPGCQEKAKAGAGADTDAGPGGAVS